MTERHRGDREYDPRFDLIFASIPDVLRQNASRFAHLEALVDGDLRLTFPELERQMMQACRSFIAQGITPGDRVAVWAPNSAEWVVAALGIHASGGILVPVNTRFKGAEAAYVLRDSGASMLLTVDDFLGLDYVGMLRETDADLPVLDRVVLMNTSDTKQGLTWAKFMASGDTVDPDVADERLSAVGPDNISDIMFTSGTTGYPKGVVLTHGQSLRAFGWFTDAIGFREGYRYLVIPPFFHTFGYKSGWMSNLIQGVTTIPMAVFDATEALRLIAQEKVSILLGPPTVYQEILNHPDRAEHDVSSIRVTMPSSTLVPRELIQRLREELGDDVSIATGYGLTEASSMVTIGLPSDTTEQISTAVGKAVPGVEVLIADQDGNEVPTGDPGEILVRGYVVMQRYWNNPEQTAAAISPEGWLRTGDIGAVDADGFLRITDRKKDMFIVGGYNAYPAEIERIFLGWEKISAVAIIGRPDERLGEVGIAFVVAAPESGLTSEHVIAWARDHMANFKVPREVRLLPDLPRNASMKIRKGELRKLLAGTSKPIDQD